jgi:hypothetical protein
MSRRGFWLGLLVGLIVMGLLAATAMFVLVRFRGSAGVYGLRGRQFGISPRGRFYPGMVGGGHGFGLMCCGPVLLLVLGALVLAAVFGRHWYHRRWGGEGRCCERQPSSAAKPVEAAQQPSAVSKDVAAEQEPPAEAGPGQGQS